MVDATSSTFHRQAVEVDGVPVRRVESVGSPANVAAALRARRDLHGAAAVADVVGVTAFASVPCVKGH